MHGGGIGGVIGGWVVVWVGFNSSDKLKWISGSGGWWVVFNSSDNLNARWGIGGSGGWVVVWVVFSSSDNLNALWGIGGSWRGFQLFWQLKCMGWGWGVVMGAKGGGVTFNSFDNLYAPGGLVVMGVGGGVGVAFNFFDNLNALWEIGGGRVVVVEGLSSLLTA